MEKVQKTSADLQSKDPIMNSCCPVITKYPVKRLEHRIEKYVKVLEIDLSRLFRHMNNISKLTNTEDWSGLHKEQVNASRTTEQIKVTVKEIERVRSQVKEEDLGQFDDKVKVVKVKTVLAMEKLMGFIGKESHSSLQTQTSDSGFHDEWVLGNESSTWINKFRNQHFQQRSYSEPSDSQDGDGGDTVSETSFGSLPVPLAIISGPLLKRNIYTLPQDSHSSASWELLLENITDLNDVVHQFAAEDEQHNKVTQNPGNNTKSAEKNIIQGAQQDKALDYKTALLPVVGAVVGGVVAGPIGLVAGLKVGGLVGAVGGAVGFAGGKLVKAHQKKLSETEVKYFSDKTSLSLSDIPESKKPERRRMSSLAENTEQKKLPSNEQKAEVDEEEKDVFSAVTTSFKKFFL